MARTVSYLSLDFPSLVSRCVGYLAYNAHWRARDQYDSYPIYIYIIESANESQEESYFNAIIFKS